MVSETYFVTRGVIRMRRTRMQLPARKQRSSGINYLLIAMWIIVLLGWLYATIVLIIDSRSERENKSPNKAGQYELHRR